MTDLRDKILEVVGDAIAAERHRLKGDATPEDYACAALDAIRTELRDAGSMNDLLRRLGNERTGWASGLCAEAKAEIERLTAALAAERKARERAEAALRAISEMEIMGAEDMKALARAALSRTAQPEGGDGS